MLWLLSFNRMGASYRAFLRQTLKIGDEGKFFYGDGNVWKHRDLPKRYRWPVVSPFIQVYAGKEVNTMYKR